MSVVIVSSSSENEEDKDIDEHVKKKIKLSTCNGKNSKSNSGVICLDSDDPESDENVVSVTQKVIENNMQENNNAKLKNSTDEAHGEFKCDLDKVEVVECTNGDESKRKINPIMSNTNEENLLSKKLKNNLGQCKEMTDFLEACKKCVASSSLEKNLLKKYPMIEKLFNSLSKESLSTDHLKKYLKVKTPKADTPVPSVVIYFKDVYEYLRDLLNSEKIVVDPKVAAKVDLLSGTVKRLIKKIKHLEESEVNFDTDDSDSAYIQQDRYMRRLNKVYKKLCQVMNVSSSCGRATENKLDFIHSRVDDFNKTICKNYRNKFPSFGELHSCLQKVKEERRLALTDAELKVEASLCFEKLGNTLQQRRQMELYEAQSCFILEGHDPALKDKELENKLKDNFKKGKVKLENVFTEFVKKQELGSVEDDVISIGSQDSDCNSLASNAEVVQDESSE